MKVTTLYKFGFNYKGVMYAWKNKKLYKLPHTKNKKSYNLKEIPMYCFKSTFVFNIQREKLTMNKLRSLTKEINVEVISFIEDSVPF